MKDHDPQFGACVPIEFAPAFADAGWDFIEVVVSDLLSPAESDSQWSGLARVQNLPIPVRAANRLLPADLKVVGTEVSQARLRAHMETVARRAHSIGIEILVFGSGGARMVPEGFDRTEARAQILDFCRMAAEVCAASDVLLVAEPLNRGECNIINSVAEAMTYVNEIKHPSFECLVDSYHLWLEDEPIEHVRDAMASIRHVHVADVKGRAAPGATGENDYRPLFALLQGGGYDGMITVESTRLEDEPDGGAKTLAFLKAQWSAAGSGVAAHGSHTAADKLF